MTKQILIFTTALVLTGCQSVGTQYISPTPTQPNATFQTRNNVLATSFNEKGCYSGRTKVPKNEGFLLQPGKEVFMTYEGSWGPSRATYPADGGFCRVVFSFVPDEGAHYIFKARYVESTGKRQPAYCTGDLEKSTADTASEPVAIKFFYLRQRSLACIRAEPLSE